MDVKETHLLVASCTCPDWDLGLKLQARCLSLREKSNLRPFAVQADTLTTDPPSQGYNLFEMCFPFFSYRVYQNPLYFILQL